jgi:hypothetical protein
MMRFWYACSGKRRSNAAFGVTLSAKGPGRLSAGIFHGINLEASGKKAYETG